MTDAVAAGLGRNGPWLQNRWLRVESRQDDGSISPIALATQFRPMERVLGRVRATDGRAFDFGRADYDMQPHEDVLGRGRRLVLRSGLSRGVRLEREVVLYDAHPYCVTRIGATNEGDRPLAVASMHVCTTPDAGRGRLRIGPRPGDVRVYRNGWQSWSPTMSLAGDALDVRSRVPELAPEPPEATAGRFASDDMTVLYDPVSGASLLAGANTARDFLTQAWSDVPGRALDVRCLCDGIELAPGEQLWSEWVLLDLEGEPNEQLARYGDALGARMEARVPERTPAGWCSWYYFFTQVTEEDVVRNLRFLESNRARFPVDTVQIDDGYQADIGDWLTVNEKFPQGMGWLATEIKRAGFVPGIWLAPFLIAESSETYAKHADWLVRDANGDPVVATNNWQRRNFGLDGSHPDARAWLTDLFGQVCDGWGYDYVKIDFLFGAAVSGRRHDAQATRVRAYRDALAAVRAGVGDGRFILGCGSLMAPSVGYFDGNRIGPDVAPFWRYLTRAERAELRPRARTPDDGLSAEGAIRNTLQRWWMHGRLWANDPDCLLVREDRTRLTESETRTLATAIGLSAGMMLSSDDLGRVPEERLGLLEMLLPVLPASAVPIDGMRTDMPSRFELRAAGGKADVTITALFNVEDDAAELALDLPPGRWHVWELWEERYRGACEGEVRFPLVEAHGVRLVVARRDRGVPAVVGTTGHIGAGALDVAAETWDEESGTLSVTLLPVGRRRRRVFITRGGRRAVQATIDEGGDAADVDVRLEGDAAVVSADVSAPSVLRLTFAEVEDGMGAPE